MMLKVEIEDDKEYEGLLSNMKRQKEKLQKNAVERKGCLKNVRKKRIPFLYPHTCNVHKLNCSAQE